jgi:hypothetical protein
VNELRDVVTRAAVRRWAPALLASFEPRLLAFLNAT